MQGSNPGLLHCRQTLYCLSHQRSPSKKAVCKPSLDGYESEIGREGSSEAAIPVPQPDSLLLALVYRGDVKTGELGCSSLEQTSMLHFESAKKKKKKKPTTRWRWQQRVDVEANPRDGSQRTWEVCAENWQDSNQKSTPRLRPSDGFILWNLPFVFLKWSGSPYFSGGSDSKESACNAGDPGLMHGLGRFPGEGKGNPLQYSCLENSMDRGPRGPTVYGGHKEPDTWATHTFRILWSLRPTPPAPATCSLPAFCL